MSSCQFFFFCLNPQKTTFVKKHPEFLEGLNHNYYAATSNLILILASDSSYDCVKSSCDYLKIIIDQVDGKVQLAFTDV